LLLIIGGAKADVGDEVVVVVVVVEERNNAEEQRLDTAMKTSERVTRR